MISESFARELAGEPTAAIGKRIRTFVETDAWREVVGVVQGVHENGLYEDAGSFIYFPTLVADMYGTPLYGTRAVAFAIRSERVGTASLMNEVRQAIWSVNAGIPVTLFGARETTHRKINADLGRPDDPGTKAVFEFIGRTLKK